MKKIIAITLVALTVVIGCKNGDKLDGYEYTENGLGYQFHRKNDTAKLAVYNSEVFAHIKARDLDGKVLINISDSTGGKPISFIVSELPDTGDLFEGVAMMRQGDSATFVVKAKTFYEGSNDYPEGMNADSKILVDLSLVKVFTPEDIANAQQPKYTTEELDAIRAAQWENEVKNMETYFAKEGITDYKTLETGVKVAVTKKGEGKKVEAGDKVEADFVFYVLSNNALVMSTINAGEPYTFKSIGDVQYSELPGLHDAIKGLSVGDEVVVAVPFDRAFGEKQMSEEIPAFSTLVGTIKILSVKE